MSDQQTVELLLGLLLATVLLAVLARRIRVPYPILFVLGGLGLSLVPGLPRVTLPPDLLLLVFIPPLAYSAAVFITPEEIQTYLRPFALLAVGLVIVGTAVVALVAHFAIGMDWAPAAALGAIVSSTDATAVAAISEHLPLPSQVVTILEGESLFDDATSLVLYRLAVMGGSAGAFSLVALTQGFLAAAVGALVVGLVVGWLAVQLRRRVEDTVSEITLGLLIPFAAWIPAERFGFSGVLAVAVAGIFVGRVRFGELDPLTRRWSAAFWQVLTFLLEGLLFILVGLEGRTILDQLTRPAPQLLGYALAICATVIVVRILGVFIAAYSVPVIGHAVDSSVRYPSWRQVTLVAWAGMRGGESLAPALALPVMMSNGNPYPDRGLIIFLTFAVILVTLLVQGLSLPSLIRRLGLSSRAAEAEATQQAQLEVARATLAQLDALAVKANAPAEAVRSVRAELEHHIRDLSDQSPQGHVAQDTAKRRLDELVLATERETAQQMMQQGRISDDVMRGIERVLDLRQLELKTQADDDRSATG